MRIFFSFKIITIIVVLSQALLFCHLINAQGTTNAVNPKPVDYSYLHEAQIISFYGENNIYPKSGDFSYTFGARLDFNSDIIGFYYKFGIGANPEGNMCGHLPLGLEAGIGLGLLAYYNGNYLLLLPAIICAIIPEGITAKFWKRDKYNLKFYLSPWGSEINLYKEDAYSLVSGECGIQGSIFAHKSISMSCYAGAKTLYKGFRPAVTMGATVGFVLD
jgi:hypothetical protein